MSESVLRDHVTRFRAILANQLGLAFEEERLGQLAEVLSERAASRGGNRTLYLDQLEREPTLEEQSAIARRVTVAETYFFRHSQQFDALRSILVREFRASAPPRLLSAGCASGEEAYSLVMLMRELWPNHEPAVVALDLNPAILERARDGRYSDWSLRETPALAVARWFRQQGCEYVVDDSIRRAVTFVQANLAGDEPELLAPGSFDVVFCRNVLMYFTPENFRAAVRRLTRALVPEGYLFMGSAETLRGISQDYHLCHTHGSFYYQRKRELERRPPSLQPEVQNWRQPPPEAEMDPSAWVEEIRRAAARITALSDEPARGAAPNVLRETSARRGLDLSHALDLLHREQFSAALEHVRALPAAAARDPEAMLLEAVLLASGGRLGEAEQACQRLLAVDELNTGAHYVLALCSAGGGQRDRAVHHDRVALYLDPGFAMPRLHLGLMLRREGDRTAARLEADRTITSVPSRHPELLGIAGVRGAVVAVFDLASLLDLPRPDISRWLVLAKGAPLAFAFSAFEGQLSVPREALARAEDGRAGRVRDMVHREGATGEGTALPVIDIPGLVAALDRRPRPRGGNAG